MISRKKKLTLSVLNILAISGTKGSSGLGSQSKEQIDNNTVTKVKKDEFRVKLSLFHTVELTL